jgi:hypothetical protein
VSIRRSRSSAFISSVIFSPDSSESWSVPVSPAHASARRCSSELGRRTEIFPQRPIRNPSISVHSKSKLDNRFATRTPFSLVKTPKRASLTLQGIQRTRKATSSKKTDVLSTSKSMPTAMPAPTTLIALKRATWSRERYERLPYVRYCLVCINITKLHASPSSNPAGGPQTRVVRVTRPSRSDS